VGSSGTIVVDAGARTALTERNVSLLPAGVRAVHGRFQVDDAVEVADESGQVFAKGLVRLDAATLGRLAGSRTGDLPEGVPHEVIHRDDLVVLP
jgi:glutamate 5-kinase